jgi:hypothetical protein
LTIVPLFKKNQLEVIQLSRKYIMEVM